MLKNNCLPVLLFCRYPYSFSVTVQDAVKVVHTFTSNSFTSNPKVIQDGEIIYLLWWIQVWWILLQFFSVPVQDAVKGVILLFPILLLAILWVIQDGEIIYLVWWKGRIYHVSDSWTTSLGKTKWYRDGWCKWFLFLSRTTRTSTAYICIFEYVSRYIKMYHLFILLPQNNEEWIQSH